MGNVSKYTGTERKREILEDLLRKIDSHEDPVWEINDYNIIANQAVEIIKIAFEETIGKQLEDSLPIDSRTQSIYDTGRNARAIGIGKIRGQLVGLLNRLDSEEEARTTITPIGSPNSVFLVHGHDNEAKETIARFVRSYLKNGRLGLEPKLGASQWTLQTNNGQ